MSLQKKDRKIQTVSGKGLPKSSDRDPEQGGYDFTKVIAETLRTSLGGTHATVKTIMGYTRARERTVKNWLEAKNGPNGENLVELIRHSDEVLEAILRMAGREEILAGKLLVDAHDKLVEMLEIIDQLRVSSKARISPVD